MSVKVILELPTKHGQLEKLIDYVTSVLPETRKRDGFVSIDVCSDLDKPNTMVLVEEWRSREAYEAYFKWRTETGVIEKVLSFADGSPSIRFLKKA